MSTDPSAARRGTPDPRMPVRASRVLSVPVVWLAPLAVASFVVAIIAALYISSVINPTSQLRGLPVGVVNQDNGATIGSWHLNIGQQVQGGLLASPKVSGPLRLELSTLRQAQRATGSDNLYAMLVIPPDFTASLLSVAGLPVAGPGAGTAPHVQILTNQRAGLQGATLATEILQQALMKASPMIGKQLAALSPAGSRTAATRALLASPVAVMTTQFRPLPPNTALGSSAFYVSLLTIMCGFLGGIIVSTMVDSVLGYASTEIGPRRRQRRPLPINRWQTLLIKWSVITTITAVLTAVLLVVAWAVGMDEPHPFLLWAYAWLCAACVGIAMIVLLAAAGLAGQLLGLLLFVYGGLASAGGVVPEQALPGPLRTLSNVEPLRQTVGGVRSILYFNAQADAGLARGALVAALSLVFWLVVGTVIVKWYDHKGLYRLQPDFLSHVRKSLDDYDARQAGPSPAPPADGQSPGGEAGPPS